MQKNRICWAAAAVQALCSCARHRIASFILVRPSSVDHQSAGALEPSTSWQGGWQQLAPLRNAMARKRATFVIGMSFCYARYGGAFILAPSRPLSSFAARTRGATCLLGAAGNARNFSKDRRRERRKHTSPTTNEVKGPHPRNSFEGSYDMEKLCRAYPPLKSFIISPDSSAKARSKSSNKAPSRPTIKFADPNAVRALNTALLVADYNIAPDYAGILPTDALIPPVPGRADYIHFVADLLGAENGRIPDGPSVRGLDIGTGASVIYPLIATSAYGWSMIASEINPISVQSADRIIQSNELENLIDLRQQESQKNIFDGIWEPNKEIDFIMCNPPFFPSLEAFQAENARKIKGLARGGMNKRKPRDNLKEVLEGK